MLIHLPLFLQIGKQVKEQCLTCGMEIPLSELRSHSEMCREVNHK